MRRSLIFLMTLFVQQTLNAEAGILRCVSAIDGAATAEIRYQSEPCPPGFTQTVPLIIQAPTPVPGEPILQAESARTVTPTGSSRASSRVKRATTGVGKPHRRKKLQHEAALSQAGCPATYEDGGVYVVSNRWVKTPSGARSKAHAGMRAAWEDYKSLPTKTYLKNAGRWPKHCPP